MTRLLKLLFAIALFMPLTACGIKGGLKTPPPVWGSEADAAQSDEADTASSDTETDLLEEDEEDVGYGVDVAGTP